MDSKKKGSNDPGLNQHNPQYANYWAPLTRKRHIPPHPAQPQHTNDWAPRTRKRHQQEHRPQRPTESSDPTQHAKGRTDNRPGHRKETTTGRNVTRGGGGGGFRKGDNFVGTIFVFQFGAEIPPANFFAQFGVVPAPCGSSGGGSQGLLVRPSCSLGREMEHFCELGPTARKAAFLDSWGVLRPAPELDVSRNHLEERLLDQAQARASYTPLFWGHSRSIPQGMILDVQPLVKSLFCPIRPSPNGFLDSEASIP